jgi:malonate-semialdehyde dehydrogenase (acetylating) / methylmalonate-semialdehyde dehydrogenase
MRREDVMAADSRGAAAQATRTLGHFVGGRWVESRAARFQDVINPATGELLARVPLGDAEEVAGAVAAAQAAFPAWRATPPGQRAHYLFELKVRLEKHFEDLARTITREHGKTLDEARGSVRRGIDNVERAAAIPSLLMGDALEDVGRDVDCEAIRQPVGVFAAVCPFNFPVMVPLWFLPYAIACGNTFVMKPSEQVPLSSALLVDLLQDTGLPTGVVNLVNGAREAVDALLDHPEVRGVSFVGSSPVAEYVYRRAAERGKRVQSLGGAKNFIVVMPDADLDPAADAITESAFGNAGERCLAGSVVLAVGDVQERLRQKLAERARALRVGDGMDPATQMGPVISKPHRERVLRYIESGVQSGAEMVVDGRPEAARHTQGNFLGATFFDRVEPSMQVAQEEIFGPVLCMIRVPDLETAIATLRAHPLGNATSIFTTSGKHARQFKYNAQVSMIGVNIGVAAPMAFFPFGGTKGSFFGDTKAHGNDAINFYTDKKVIISRWI